MEATTIIENSQDTILSEINEKIQNSLKIEDGRVTFKLNGCKYSTSQSVMVTGRNYKPMSDVLKNIEKLNDIPEKNHVYIKMSGYYFYPIQYSNN